MLPLCSEVAGRDVVPVLARQAGVLAGDAVVLDAVASLLDPRTRPPCRQAPEAVSRRSVRDWLTGSGGRPPARRGRARARSGPEGAAGSPGPGVPAGGAGPRADFDHPDEAEARTGWPRRSGTVAPVATAEDELPGSRRPLEDGPGVGRVIVSESDLRARIVELGLRITADYAGRPPLLVGVLKGAFMFMSDLSRAITLPVEVDFMAVSSYGSATRTSGVVRIVKDLDVDLADRHVLVVEDIVDSGLTLTTCQRYLLARDPASLEVCAPPGQGRPTAHRPRSARMSGFTSRPNSWWDMALTSTSACEISRPSTPTPATRRRAG